MRRSNRGGSSDEGGGKSDVSDGSDLGARDSGRISYLTFEIPPVAFAPGMSEAVSAWKENVRSEQQLGPYRFCGWRDGPEASQI